jgi:hypothetical protein
MTPSCGNSLDLFGPFPPAVGDPGASFVETETVYQFSQPVASVTLLATVENSDTDPAVAAAFGTDGTTVLDACEPPPISAGSRPCVTILGINGLQYQMEYQLHSPGILYVAVVNTLLGSAGVSSWDVPEPGTIGLMGLALVAAALVRRMRSSRV